MVNLKFSELAKQNDFLALVNLRKKPHAVEQSCRVEAELSDIGSKDTFLPDLRVEIPEASPDVVGLAFVV